MYPQRPTTIIEQMYYVKERPWDQTIGLSGELSDELLAVINVGVIE